MFFDLPEAGERALLVHCETGGKKQSDTAVSNSPAGYRSAEGESVSGSLDGDNPEVGPVLLRAFLKPTLGENLCPRGKAYKTLT